jgi:hypothetical protein
MAMLSSSFPILYPFCSLVTYEPIRVAFHGSYLTWHLARLQWRCREDGGLSPTNNGATMLLGSGVHDVEHVANHKHWMNSPNAQGYIY